MNLSSIDRLQSQEQAGEEAPGASDGPGKREGPLPPHPCQSPGGGNFSSRVPTQLQLGPFMAFIATPRAKRNQFVWRSGMKEISIDL